MLSSTLIRATLLLASSFLGHASAAPATSGAIALVNLYPSPQYVGKPFTLTGDYAVCHDLPTTVQNSVLSIMFATGTSSCVLFDTRGCKSDVRNITIDRSIAVEHMPIVLSLECLGEVRVREEQ